MPQSIVFNLSDVHDALGDAVDEYGADWVDPNSSPTPDSASQCRYSYTHEFETRHCIVGKVVADLARRHGVFSTKIDEFFRRARCGSTSAIRTLSEDHGIDFTPEARELLEILQTGQDRGAPWGALRAIATRVVPVVRRAA